MSRKKLTKRGSKRREQQKAMETTGTAPPPETRQTLEERFAQAVELVEQSRPAEALKVAKQLYSQVQGRSATEVLPALNLLGEISIELGAVDSARDYFEKAVHLDPDGRIPEALGGGAEKFLWLAQLCDEGGKGSVGWFEKGARALQNEISALENGQIPGMDEDALLMMRVEKKRKLANTLCAVVEVYMTDLSWEDDAEARCESLITEALTVEDDTSPEVLQTLASVRLSQERKEDAQAALERSLEAWIDLEPEDPSVPDFATKISLSRLLMEAEMERKAMEVLHRLVQEDDQSVEAWYLGGWCQNLIAEGNKAGVDQSHDNMADADAGAEAKSASGVDPGQKTEAAMQRSRRWLKTSLKLYEQQDYEDDRLFEHAKELVTGLDTVLGPEAAGADGEDEDEWSGISEDEEDEEDEEMKDA